MEAVKWQGKLIFLNIAKKNQNKVILCLPKKTVFTGHIYK